MNISQAEQLSISLSTMLSAKGIVGYKIARNLRMIEEELKEYHDIKAELFHKYGEEKDGQLIISKLSGNYLKYQSEIEEIEQQEVSFDFKAITDEELQNCDLNAQQMMFLMEHFGG